MKKQLLYLSTLFVTFLIILGMVSRPTLSTNVPSSMLLFNKLGDTSPSFPKLFYSSINLTHTTSYHIANDQLIPEKEKYTPYTEGFIPKSLYDKLYAILSTYLPTPPPSFHDYYVSDDLAVVAFSGGLENIYIINLKNATVYPLIFDPSQNLGKMYVSHMRIVDDKLILLGGEAHALSSLVYTVDYTTGKVLSTKRLPTHAHALYEEDFAILSSGECIFVADDRIQYYNPLTDTEQSIPLPFNSTRVLAYEDTALVFGESERTLQVLSLDGTIHFELPLPVINGKIVDLVAEDTLLYVAIFDPNATRYTNYICLYDLRTAEWVYSLGLQSIPNQALLFLDF